MSHSGEGVGSPDVFATLNGGKDEIGAASIKRSNYARVGKVGHNRYVGETAI